MDMSMPFMGGMGATGLVRSCEVRTGLAPILVPILALCVPLRCARTATRFPLVIGDCEQCLQAGIVNPARPPAPTTDLMLICRCAHWQEEHITSEHPGPVSVSVPLRTHADMHPQSRSGRATC